MLVWQRGQGNFELAANKVLPDQQAVTCRCFVATGRKECVKKGRHSVLAECLPFRFLLIYVIVTYTNY